MFEGAAVRLLESTDSVMLDEILYWTNDLARICWSLFGLLCEWNLFLCVVVIVRTWLAT